ncbi:dienelactone hydrolase family protein [Streptomyces sp. Je 1-4]|uniref:dienelactone hydrolase family protein n=1 Tax=Streptomyces TaxID=1883 RepID=UPI00140EE169|nr:MULTISPECIES: dienelactone hydrolase family protein [unclassified Streptomyces]QIK05978.1 dienelactone hydrolase [Streptomyces sp. ID38640]UYB39319.1 dienelactone hydrolase family protein [Streptomyces sp. Je 1-4]UZQ35345.1 dienelactone hydrolase family protein [Streptomyces sp. Je 1-4] [Streptomyces sp. Je 1-4 4N24]UZQ42763.1 dienelactone hydrolase family protein [Streptomyces sp. Je 1-4] [Streptomyces sp. Je 1-4 4N24_ara]
MADHDLTGFDRGTFTHEGTTRRILRRGTGPAVIVLAEIPGITPKVLEFAERVAAIGCTAVLPVLFGTPGRDADPAHIGRLKAGLYMASSIGKVCVSREFTVLATGKSSPVVTWLRALAAHEHQRCGGPGVGAVGMCLTGGFALAMATDERLLAPVLSQPSLPLALTKSRGGTTDISAEELATVRGRCEREGLRVMGLRFRGDRLVPGDRFAFLRRELGEAFTAVELDDSAARPDAVQSPHSVLTEHLIDAPGQPTRAALDEVLDLFRTRLLEQGPLADTEGVGAGA